MTIEDISMTNSFVSSTHKKHIAFTPVQHWQLRDLIKPHPDGIIYTDSAQIITYNPDTHASNIITSELFFQPTAIAYNEGVAAVVGSKGQLLVVKDSVFKCVTGATINNSVQIYNNPPRICICSNDGTLKIYDLNTFRLVQTVTHNMPINNCEISIDGKMLICVGDTNNVYGYYYDGEFKPYDTFTSVRDAGFKISWNNLSDRFAVSTQDGYCCVWDIRSKDKLAAIKSKQSPQAKGAVRVVEFSRKKNLDLILFAEHMTYFTVVDCRDFKKKQIVSVAENNFERGISGCMWSNSGDEIFVAAEDTILEYKVETLSRRMFSSKDQM